MDKKVERIMGMYEALRGYRTLLTIQRGKEGSWMVSTHNAATQSAAHPSLDEALDDVAEQLRAALDMEVAAHAEKLSKLTKARAGHVG